MKIDPELKEIGQGISQVVVLARFQELPMVTSYLEMAFDELARVVVERQEAVEQGGRASLGEEPDESGYGT